MSVFFTEDQTKLLAEARDEAFMVFSDLAEVSAQCCDLATAHHAEQSEKDVETLENFRSQIQNIRAVISRHQFKVVFFGRTSSGKSTLINAMLGDTVLPSGLGHTTNCFIQIQGTEDKRPSLMMPLGNAGCFQEVSVDNVQDISEVLNRYQSEKEAGEDNVELVVLNWPQERCPLLAEDVVLVDSPGVDMTRSHDTWIQKYCQDADIFILVANSESTIMLREKAFFKSVAETVSGPNIMVVENRWDCSEFEEEDTIEAVRRQHLDRCTEFLCGELGGLGVEFVKDRVFFTSSREILNWRLNKFIPQPSHHFNGRREEFDRFERMLKHHLTSTAVHTKYGTHFLMAKNICLEILRILDTMLHHYDKEESSILADKERLNNLIEITDVKMKDVSSELKDYIGEMMENICQRVAVVYHEETNNLNLSLVNYKLRLSDDVLRQVYFEELEKHLENCLTLNVGRRISEEIRWSVEDCHRQIKSLISSDIIGDHAEKTGEQHSIGDIKIIIHAKTNSHTDFCFGGEFSFSYGLFYWLKNYKEIVVRMFPGLEDRLESPGSDLASVRTLAPRLALLVLASANTMSGMLTGSLVCRSGIICENVKMSIYKIIIRRFVWRAGGVILLSHLGLYVYERLLWETGGRERRARSSFLSHFQARARPLVHIAAASVRQQIQQV